MKEWIEPSVPPGVTSVIPSVTRVETLEQLLLASTGVLLEYGFFRDRPFEAADQLKEYFNRNPEGRVFFLVSVGRMFLEKEALIQDFRETALRNQNKQISVFTHSPAFRSRVLGAVGLSHRVLGVSAASVGWGSSVLQIGMICRSEAGPEGGGFPRLDDPALLHPVVHPVAQSVAQSVALPEEGGKFPLAPVYPQPVWIVRILKMIFSIGGLNDQLRKLYRRTAGYPRLRNFLVKAYRFARRIVS